MTHACLNSLPLGLLAVTALLAACADDVDVKTTVELDGNAYSRDAEVEDVALLPQDAAGPKQDADQSCSYPEDCPQPGENDICLQAVCKEGRCGFAPKTGCCITKSDCGEPESNLQEYLCEDHTCRLQIVEGACEEANDCDGELGDCQEWKCEGNRCQKVAKDGCVLCGSERDCAQYANDCQSYRCDAGTCDFITRSNCCLNETTCPAPENICLRATCKLNTCGTEPIENCCVKDDDCESNDVCLEGSCNQTTHRCSFSSISNCCKGEEDCPVSNECLRSFCTSDHVCQTVPNGAGCCLKAEDCTHSTCETPICAENTCQTIPIRNCCTKADDCPTPTDTCREAYCNGDTCDTRPIENCCRTASDCTGDPGYCKEWDCVSNRCQQKAANGCTACENRSDCAQSAGVCEDYSCQAGYCQFTPKSNCCDNPLEDCQTPTDVCLEAYCNGTACATRNIENCCRTASDCTGDPGYCQEWSCVGNRCAPKSASGCISCGTPSDCASFVGSCQNYSCQTGYCQFTPKSNCCDDPGEDCPPTGSVCVEAYCNGTACATRDIENCCEGNDFSHCDASQLDACHQFTCRQNQCVKVAISNCCLNEGDCSGGRICNQNSHTCEQPSQNYVDWCNFQSPVSGTYAAGESFTAYARIYEGSNAAVTVKIGYVLAASDNGSPDSNWTFIDATLNTGAGLGNNKEYQATISIPTAGTYHLATLVSVEGNTTLCHAGGQGSDGNQAGNVNNAPYDKTKAGVVTITSPCGTCSGSTPYCSTTAPYHCVECTLDDHCGSAAEDLCEDGHCIKYCDDNDSRVAACPSGSHCEDYACVPDAAEEPKVFISEYERSSIKKDNTAYKAIELYNPGRTPVSLVGYKLVHNSTTEVTLTGTIGAGELYVVCEADIPAAITCKQRDLPSGFGHNSGIELKDPDGTVIDSFGTGSTKFMSVSGTTYTDMQRRCRASAKQAIGSDWNFDEDWIGVTGVAQVGDVTGNEDASIHTLGKYTHACPSSK